MMNTDRNGSSDGGGGERKREDVDLPAEILKALPTEPEHVLHIANQITRLAFASSLTKLEMEVRELKSTISEKDEIIQSLEERISVLQQNLADASDRLSLSLEQQAKLSQENSSLMLMVKKLNKDVTKLEAFKKTLMQSLQDDYQDANCEAIKMEVSQTDTNIPRSTELSSKEEYTYSHNVREESHVQVSGADDEGIISPINGTELSAVKTSVTPSKVRGSAPAPVESPKRGHLSLERIGVSDGAQSPRTAASTASRLETEKLPLFSSSGSCQSTAPNSPPRSGRPPRVDGKEFFRQARSRLSYEQFTAFLANIKELNSHRQSREETLHKADEIFGAENRDLYVTFDNLLNRHL